MLVAMIIEWTMQPHSRLLTLPVELRLCIYEFVSLSIQSIAFQIPSSHCISGFHIILESLAFLSAWLDEHKNMTFWICMYGAFPIFHVTTVTTLPNLCTSAENPWHFQWKGSRALLPLLTCHQINGEARLIAFSCTTFHVPNIATS